MKISKASSLHFTSSYVPVLKTGDYSVRARQKVKIADIEAEFYGNELNFYVGAPKFELEAGMVHHVYPAQGMEGSFMADVPSITFNRVSLPWERTRKHSTGSQESWLVLFLLDETEQQKTEEGIRKAKDLFTAESLEPRHQDDLVSFLKIPDDLMVLLPRQNEYQYIAYCRMGSEESNAPEDTKSVIVCNRLPKPGHTNTVYLLSLEHIAAEAGYKSFSYLYKWQFYCQDAESYLIPSGSKPENGVNAFPDEITNVLFESSSKFEKVIRRLEPKPDEQTIETYKTKYKTNSGSFHGRLHQLSGKFASFRYPADKTNGFIQQGGVILKEGNRYIGYRGPLQATPVPLYPTCGNLEWTGVQKFFQKDAKRKPNADRSYQVAYELGFLTALKDAAFHKPFFEWKHEVSLFLLTEKNTSSFSHRGLKHLPQSSKQNIVKPLPPFVIDKIESWKKLHGIPYSYLIPSTKMLPPESIRHFFVDVNWINAFLLGAFSIGNSYDSVEDDLIRIYETRKLFLSNHRRGLLVNSIVVSGWRQYELDAVFQQHSCELLVRKQLAKNIDFFLFEGSENIGPSEDTFTFHLPAGKSHSGFRHEDGVFTKQFRKPGSEHDTSVQAAFHDSTNRLYNIEALLNDAKGEMSSAYFGMMLQEGTPKVAFSFFQP